MCHSLRLQAAPGLTDTNLQGNCLHIAGETVATRIPIGTTAEDIGGSLGR